MEIPAKVTVQGQNQYALVLEYDARATGGSYAYVDAAGVPRDWGAFKIRALGVHKGRGGFTITCRSDIPPDVVR